MAKFGHSLFFSKIELSLKYRFVTYCCANRVGFCFSQPILCQVDGV